jgi:tRNA pseudouridine55 synthase
MRRRLDAVLLLDKACGMSANAALQAAKRLFGAAKAGHAGTLDPLASGLLPLLFGEATKFARFALDADKSYEATVQLGVATTTGDAEGEVLARRQACVDEDTLQRGLARFRGAIDQVPPMHSALKRGGRPLYALARRGLSVERAPRRVTVHELELLQREGALLRIRLRASKGTYVRQLAVDLGETLATGAHLVALRRTRVGTFELGQAVTLEALAAMDPSQRDARLLPVESLLERLPRLGLEADQTVRFLAGQAVAVAAAHPGRYQVHGARGNALLGIGELDEHARLRPVRLLASAARAGASG